MKISPVPKILRKYLFDKITNLFLSLKKIIISRKTERSKEDIKSKVRKIESLNIKYSDLQGQKMQRKKTIKTDIHNQETSEVSETKCCECWENYMQTTTEDDWIECVSCRNWLLEFCSPYENKWVDCHRKLMRDKNSKM